MIHEFKYPKPVVTEDGEDGYAIYVESGGQFENDIWCGVVLFGGGASVNMPTKFNLRNNYGIRIRRPK